MNIDSLIYYFFYLFWKLPLILVILSCLSFIFFQPKSQDAIESYVSLFLLLLIIGIHYLPVNAYYKFWNNLGYKNRLFTLPWTLLTFPIYLIITDLWFYLAHRLSHKIPLLWMSHGVHHTGKTMNVALIGRASIAESFKDMLLFLPLIFIGFAPFGVLFCRQIILVNQAFCHTEKNWPKFLDKFWVTPRNHRPHHSQDISQSNGNYGGLFMLWDLLFATQCKSTHVEKYGLSNEFKSQNPFRILFCIPTDIFLKVWKSRNISYLFRFEPQVLTRSTKNESMKKYVEEL